MPYYVNLIKIFVLYNVKKQQEHIDFYTNICHTILSTFKEGGLCIGKLWDS